LLWTIGDIFFSIPATLSAFIGLMVLLISNIMSWKNIIEEKTAWDTMFWFAVLVMMANALNKYGMISWISERIVGYVGHFEWITVFTAGRGLFLYPLLFRVGDGAYFRDVSGVSCRGRFSRRTAAFCRAGAGVYL
jgi:DASS family divalent anion:Na+ symporter